MNRLVCQLAEQKATAAIVPPKVRLIACKVASHPANRFAPHAEHIGFVAYAACETYALHWAVWFVAAYLLVTGLWVVIARNVG